MPKEQDASKVFYGWFIVAACFLLTLTLGETFWSFGVFFKPLEEEFGWDRALTSSAYTAFLVGYAISIVGSSRLVDMISPRPIVFASSVVAGLGIALCSQADSINQLRVFLFIAGLGSGPTWTVASSTVMRWFHGHPRAGLALAITTTGVGFGAIIFAPLINFFVLDFGWRNAFLYVGIIFFVTIALSGLIIRRSPPVVENDAEKTPESPATSQVYAPGLRWILLSPQFLAVAAAICAAILAFQALSVHLVPHATDEGVSATTAAVALGLLGGCSIPGRILSGFLSNAIGWQRTLALALCGMAVSVVWLFFLNATWMLYAFVFCYGICHGVRIPAQLGIMTQLFGWGTLAQLVGITTAVGQVAGAAAPYLAGYVFDWTGSYAPVFLVMVAILMLAGVAVVMMKPRAPAT